MSKCQLQWVPAAEDLFIEMREIRRELDLFLRTHDRRHLAGIRRFLKETEPLLALAKRLARTEHEKELIDVVDRGFAHYTTEFNRLTQAEPSSETDTAFGLLNDELLTNEILVPARECVNFNRQVVERTNEASRVTAQA